MQIRTKKPSDNRNSIAVIFLFSRGATQNMVADWGWRWVVERTFAWLNQFRRLRVRYEKRADLHEAFLSLGCVLICLIPWNTLESGAREAFR